MFLCNDLQSLSQAIPYGYKTTFFILNSTEYGISTKVNCWKNIALKLSDDVFIPLINVKIPTIVDIYEQNKYHA